MSLSKLPRELILTISDNLPIAALSCFARSCHSLHQVLGSALITRITTENLAFVVLQRGIHHNHLPTVHLALSHNAPWHVLLTRRGCYSALEHACVDNRLDIIAALISHYGPTILTENQQPDGSYCHENQLEHAIRCNNLARTTLLLEGGASANRTVWYGYPSSDKSPLEFAAKHGSVEIVEVLIKHGADVMGASRSMDYATEKERWDVAKLLINEGVMVWEGNFPWSEDFPLGEETPEEIKAWVAAGKVYMKKFLEKSAAKTMAERQARTKEWEAEVAARTF